MPLGRVSNGIACRIRAHRQVEADCGAIRRQQLDVQRPDRGELEGLIGECEVPMARATSTWLSPALTRARRASTATRRRFSAVRRRARSIGPSRIGTSGSFHGGLIPR
jgi:hypothetical protein